MAGKIIALLIGLLVVVAGIVYLVKEKDDPECRKIYTITLIVGLVITAVAAVLLFR